MPIRVYISYLLKDFDNFKIGKIADLLSAKPEIEEILYWQENATGNIEKFMRDSLVKCNIMLLFCSKGTNESDTQKDEWTFAEYLQRERYRLEISPVIIPVYHKLEHIPTPISTEYKGIEFDFQDFEKTFIKIYSRVKYISELVQQGKWVEENEKEKKYKKLVRADHKGSFGGGGRNKEYYEDILTKKESANELVAQQRDEHIMAEHRVVECQHKNIEQKGGYLVCKDCGLTFEDRIAFEESLSPISYSDSQVDYERKIRLSDSKATHDPKIKQKYDQIKTLDKWYRDYHIRLQYIARDTLEKVSFSVYAPSSIYPGSKFILDVWAYLKTQKSELEEIAIREGAYEKIEEKGPIEAKRGDEFQILLILDPPFEVHHDVDSISWLGEITKASFPVIVPETIEIGIYSGKIEIFIDGIIKLRIHFTLKVGDSVTQMVDSTQTIKEIKYYFASYSSQDQVEVLKRIQGFMVRSGADVFVDCLSMNPGEKWEQKIYEKILESDTFLLFWSSAAKQSVWVKKEWTYALIKGLNFIQPVPLEDPKTAPPPKELESLHFHDRYLIWMKGLI
ncbi:MAG: TIR domain-containing protein [Candidatus Hodarchaeota archaeon]